LCRQSETKPLNKTLSVLVDATHLPLLGPRKKRFILSTLKEKEKEEEEEEEEGKPAEKDSTHRLAAREMMAH